MLQVTFHAGSLEFLLTPLGLSLTGPIHEIAVDVLQCKRLFSALLWIPSSSPRLPIIQLCGFSNALIYILLGGTYTELPGLSRARHERGLERSLSMNERGGTCLILFSFVPPSLLFLFVSRFIRPGYFLSITPKENLPISFYLFAVPSVTPCSESLTTLLEPFVPVSRTPSGNS